MIKKEAIYTPIDIDFYLPNIFISLSLKFSLPVYLDDWYCQQRYMPISYDHDQIMNARFDQSINEYCFSDLSIREMQKELLSDDTVRPHLGISISYNMKVLLNKLHNLAYTDL